MADPTSSMKLTPSAKYPSPEQQLTRQESPLSREKLPNVRETFSNFIFNRQQALHLEALQEATKKFR
jgi:hypothetical protein